MFHGSLTSLGPIFTFVLFFVIYVLIMSFILWVAGRIVVGGHRAKFSDAAAIVFLGSLSVAVLIALLAPVIGLLFSGLLAVLAFLALVRHYYETGWLGAFGVSITAVIVAIVVGFILGFGLVSLPMLGPFVPDLGLSV